MPPHLLLKNLLLNQKRLVLEYVACSGWSYRQQLVWVWAGAVLIQAWKWVLDWSFHCLKNQEWDQS